MQSARVSEMQIYARCVGQDGTLALLVDPWETVQSVKQTLMSCLHAPRCSDMWLAHAGQVCTEESSLAASGLREGSVVQMCVRVRGGGGDGGSTGAESRSSFLEMYARKKPAKTNPLEDKLARWTTCRLSGERLALPVVADELGFLFNKDAVVAALVTKSLPPELAHISSLRHLIDLRLARNTNYSGQSAASVADYQPGNGAEWCCPVTGLELNGRYRFAVLRGSGHVVSEKALKEVPAAVEEHVGGAWAPADVLPLNGAPGEVQALRDALLASRAVAAARKAEKKRSKNGKRAPATAADPAGAASADPAAPDAAASGAGNGAANGAAAAAGGGSGPTGGNSGPAGGNAGGAAGGSGWHGAAKRAAEDAAAELEERARAKRFHAGEEVPAHATKGVWASIFTSSQPHVKETYGCRALSSRGL